MIQHVNNHHSLASQVALAEPIKLLSGKVIWSIAAAAKSINQYQVVPDIFGLLGQVIPPILVDNP